MDTQTEDILILAAIAFGLWWLIEKKQENKKSVADDVLLTSDPQGSINQMNRNYLTPLGRAKEKTFVDSANYLIEYKLAGVPHII